MNIIKLIFALFFAMLTVVFGFFFGLYLQQPDAGQPFMWGTIGFGGILVIILFSYFYQAKKDEKPAEAHH